MNPVIVVGLQPLGAAIVRGLAARGVDTVSVALPAEAEAYRHEFQALGVTTLTTSTTLADSGLDSAIAAAAVVLLTDDNDGANVDLALRIRKLRKDVPLVVRMFDATLVEYLRTTMDNVTLLSIAGIAAPVFVSLALEALADRRPSEMSRRTYRWRPSPKMLSRLAADRVLVTAGVCHFILIVLATLYFAHALGLHPVDALYFVSSTVTTVGYGDISLQGASMPTKMVGMFLMFAGAAFVAVFFALFTGWVIDRRLEVLRGRVAVRASGHVVIVGAGNVGYRVATALAERQLRVVIIEREIGRNGASLRAQGHHVIIADGAAEASLKLAGAERAAVVLALTDADAINLEIVVKMRRLAAEVPVIARLASPELSRHISDRGDALTACSVAIASEKFAETALRVRDHAVQGPAHDVL